MPAPNVSIRERGRRPARSDRAQPNPGGRCAPSDRRSRLVKQGRCGFGPRLPMLVISPVAKHNYVDHNLSDQASIINLIEYNWPRRVAGQLADQTAKTVVLHSPEPPGDSRLGRSGTGGHRPLRAGAVRSGGDVPFRWPPARRPKTVPRPVDRAASVQPVSVWLTGGRGLRGPGRPFYAGGESTPVSHSLAAGMSAGSRWWPALDSR